MRTASAAFLAACLTISTASAMPSASVQSDHPAKPRNVVLVDESSYGTAADDTDFLFRLGMLEGHLIIGHDLLKANQTALALPHFGHPVRELYSDIKDYISDKHIPPFDGQLAKLEAAVATAPNSPDTEALYQQTITSVHAARATVPEQLRASVPEMIKVCANTIDAASGEYGEALDHGRIEVIVEYHDSRGYLSYVAEELDRMMKAHTDAASQAMLTNFKTVLAKAQFIVQPLLPGPVPRGTVSQYRAVAEEATDVANTDLGKKN